MTVAELIEKLSSHAANTAVAVAVTDSDGGVTFSQPEIRWYKGTDDLGEAFEGILLE